MAESLVACIACKKPIQFGETFCPVCGEQQNSGTGPLWLGERRLVTILFADLASFTATSEDADPEDIIEMLNRVFTRLIAECDHEEGYLDKTMGDQLMVLFGAPRAHEDDPVRAVRAALRMQAAMEELAPFMREKVGTACKLNIGINTGVVVWGRMGPSGRAAATVIGDAVNLASRLEQFATGGQIVVSDPVYFLTRRFFEFEILDPIQVKGKSKPVPVYVPIRPRQSVRLQNQASQIKSPLLERNEVLAALDTHRSLTTQGQGQIVLITGEAGLGKSRLITEFNHQLATYPAEKKPIILQTLGESAPGGGTYSPLTDLLSQLYNLQPDDTDLIRRRKVEDRADILGITDEKFLPLMGYLLGWYQDDTRLAKSSQELDYLRTSAIEAAATIFFRQSLRRPLFLLIDDLQWADASTVDWLNRLAAIKQAMQHEQIRYHLMALAAFRPQLEMPIESLHADNVLKLEPLGDMARRDLIEQLLPGDGLPSSLIERLSHESGGNPFYLEEACRGLVESEQLVRQNGIWRLTRPADQIYVPHSVEGLIMAHLDALDPVVRVVLQHASVIGMQFGYGLLTAITPVESVDYALTNLERRGLIKEMATNGAGRSFTFTQMVVREVVYRSLLRKTRRDLHEQIARLTETEIPVEPELEPDLGSLAHHYTAGGNGEKMVAYNWLAGQRALDLFEFDAAYRHLDLAWSALRENPTSDPEIYRNVASALGHASTFTGHFKHAAACYQIVEELTGDDPDEQALLHYMRGRLHLYEAEPETARHSYQQALELAPADSSLAAQVDAELRLLYDVS